VIETKAQTVARSLGRRNAPRDISDVEPVELVPYVKASETSIARLHAGDLAGASPYAFDAAEAAMRVRLGLNEEISRDDVLRAAFDPSSHSNGALLDESAPQVAQHALWDLVRGAYGYYSPPSRPPLTEPEAAEALRLTGIIERQVGPPVILEVPVLGPGVIWFARLVRAGASVTAVYLAVRHAYWQAALCVVLALVIRRALVSLGFGFGHAPFSTRFAGAMKALALAIPVLAAIWFLGGGVERWSKDNLVLSIPISLFVLTILVMSLGAEHPVTRAIRQLFQVEIYAGIHEAPKDPFDPPSRKSEDFRLVREALEKEDLDGAVSLAFATVESALRSVTEQMNEADVLRLIAIAFRPTKEEAHSEPGSPFGYAQQLARWQLLRGAYELYHRPQPPIRPPIDRPVQFEALDIAAMLHRMIIESGAAGAN
jgi:hypothetical protein